MERCPERGACDWKNMCLAVSAHGNHGDLVNSPTSENVQQHKHRSTLRRFGTNKSFRGPGTGRRSLWVVMAVGAGPRRRGLCVVMAGNRRRSLCVVMAVGAGPRRRSLCVVMAVWAVMHRFRLCTVMATGAGPTLLDLRGLGDVDGELAAEGVHPHHP